ncbi:MAG: VCBS repeat-containing protein [Proteobacteria bacterium]|nr:VCBS repeat-containing protein [Pseudomonadota bacterium]MCP4918545.1 VCBS repeat-containing protein [Pseudomonadota bacterium]
MLFLLALSACDDTNTTQDTASLGLEDSCPQECPDSELQTFYVDADGDGLGDDGWTIEAYTQPDNTVTAGGDCDDLDPEVGSATDLFADADGDGFGDATATSRACPGEGWVEDDCDDTDAAVFPGSGTPDDPDAGVDADCDGDVACEDANCDGVLDLVLGGEATYSTGDCSADLLFFGDGGDYSDVTPGEIGDGCTWASASADLDQDGYEDLVSVIRGQGTEPLEGMDLISWGGTAGWRDADQTELATIGAVGVLIEDLNADGWEDLTFIESSSEGYADFNQSSTIYWNSSGGFTSSTDLSTYGAWDMATGDLDGDGYTDLVVCNAASDFDGYFTLELDSFILWGSSGGYSDADRAELPTLSCRGVAIADLDQDGLDDVIFANSNSNSNSSYQVDSVIYWNSADGFDAADSTGLPTMWSYDVAVGDFNGDGWDDLGFSSGVASDYSDGIYSEEPTLVYWNHNGTFDTEDVAELDGDVSYALMATDLDNDGFDELIVPALNSHIGQETTSRVYWGGTAGFTHSDELPTSSPGSVTVGDQDADGHPEILFPAVYSEHGAQIYWGSDYGYHAEDSTELSDTNSVAAPLIVGDSSW